LEVTNIDEIFIHLEGWSVEGKEKREKRKDFRFGSVCKDSKEAG
jgi:hypothetical protein